MTDYVVLFMYFSGCFRTGGEPGHKLCDLGIYCLGMTHTRHSKDSQLTLDLIWDKTKAKRPEFSVEFSYQTCKFNRRPLWPVIVKAFRVWLYKNWGQ